MAVPTRTWVAPKVIASAKSALIPMERRRKPLRCAILAVRAKWGAGRLVQGRQAHQAGDRKPIGGAAALQKAVGLLRQHARLLRLAAGIDLGEQQRGAALPGDLARQRLAQRGPVDRMDGLEQRHRLLGLVGLQRPDQMQLGARDTAPSRPATSPSPPAPGSRRRPAGRPPAPARWRRPRRSSTPPPGSPRPDRAAPWRRPARSPGARPRAGPAHRPALGLILRVIHGRHFTIAAASA